MDFAAFAKVRSCLLAGALALALVSSGAWAQNAPAASDTAASTAPGAGTDTSGNELETVVVTSTRLQNPGFDAPTPTQVLNSESLTQIAQPNLFDAVIQLPALEGSTGTTYETGSTSTGLQGLSAFSLRSFSPLRTLTLIDGERVVGSNINQSVDVSLLPQMLISRVDVVTGGASASWGSDAVAGVVNLVTDKKFNGFKSDVSYGQSGYGDNRSTTAKLAAGTGFLDNKAHIEIAGEYTNVGGVMAKGNPLNNFGCQAVGGRDMDTCSGTINTSVANTQAGNPYTYFTPFNQGTTETAYGIITEGPLQGTAFNAAGQPYAFQYASGGVPSKAYSGGNAPITATAPGGLCTSANCLGIAGYSGDLTNQAQPATLASPLRRDTTYLRLSFDITPTSEIFATYNYGNSYTITEPTSTDGRPGNINVPCTNPYLLATGVFGTGGSAAEQAACNTDYPTGSLQVGEGLTFGKYQSVDINRTQNRWVLGGDGSFDLFTKNVTWDGYFEYGENTSNLHIYNMPLTPNLTASLNATTNAAGQIVCASAVAAAAGCVPYNIFGSPQSNSATALNYIEPVIGPYDLQKQRQEAGGLDFNFKPLTYWAGDLAIALGVDYRLENYHAYSDPYGNGTLVNPNGSVAPAGTNPAPDPYNAYYPADPVFSAAQVAGTGGNVWYAGNYHEGSGQYTVEEAFLEGGIPIYKIPGWGSLDADLAGRFEHYNTAGDEFTWKLGAVWNTPLSGVRIRALQSADLRAPNLSEAFAPPGNLNSGGNLCFGGGAGCGSAGNPQTTVEFDQLTIGSTKLSPETGKTAEIGLVFQPDYIRGLHMSADWYRINVTNIIGTPYSVQNILDNCDIKGLTSFCGQSSITTLGGVNINSPTCAAVPTPVACTVTIVTLQYTNLASTLTEGVDYELDYSWDLRYWNIPGAFSVRGLATHANGFRTCPNTAGSFCTDYAGANGNYSTSTAYAAAYGTLPKWKTDFSEQYGNTWGSIYIAQRWFSSGTFSNNDIQCNPGSCPAETATQVADFPTINYNHMPGAIYWDAGVTINAGAHAELYGKVNNIFNDLAPPTASGGVNNTLYDIIGRMFYFGFRLNY